MKTTEYFFIKCSNNTVMLMLSLMSLRYKQNRQRILDAGLNLLDYEGGNADPVRSNTRRWQQAKIYNVIMSDTGSQYHGMFSMRKAP